MADLKTDQGGHPSPPSHHDPAGGFRNPWPGSEVPGFREMLRWRREARQAALPANPHQRDLPVVSSDVAVPRAAASELRTTWLGHSTFLIQIAGLNVLTDPHLSERASPVSWAGPKRFVPPSLLVEALPPIDAVLLSHDHYDHLDEPTVRRLAARFGDALEWLTPLGYRDWFASRRVKRVTELDWWGEAVIRSGEGEALIRCLPAQHWTSRSPFYRLGRLWSSWSVAGAGRSVYFGGDSGWFPEYPRIGEAAGPFDLTLLPIGAYEPRWFMKTSHMNPEDAVRAFLELGSHGTMGGMHWGTFRLTDEDPLEPPLRTREAWNEAGLPKERLWLPAHGATLVMP
ncbi:MAG: MBL fold metallo-hydrolase [Gemmatimonadetes bacterium]|nr:MBL fold metallo-hydrolase [Gemmatimonadota bacterium]